MAVHPYQPAAVLILALNTVIKVFEDFSYHRQLASDDGLNAVPNPAPAWVTSNSKALTLCALMKTARSSSLK